MEQTELTYQQKINIMDHLGDVYRSSRRRVKLAQDSNSRYVSETLLDDYETIKMLESVLNDCTENTRMIIRNGFFETRRKDWYVTYCTQSSYYRRRKKAVEEYLHGLQF